ncbi:acyl-CoA thioesterase [Actinomadura verrucosospora]|uniref:Thioesterase superfamily protein n=1 Tax=Actinomadura verrucosospora TaxID=46165 RepID=A0A7D3VZN0_ACTVE|nr:thioesterase family protein [Actinomadura verrucosospora]QKG24954.1 thioesterase superfamily protein [Actinomadura verrucosospora]
MTLATEPFSVRMDVRVYEIDPQLHLNGGFYVQYADHARFACVEAAGVSVQELIADGYGPVNLETVIRYHHELRGGDQVDVTCEWEWGDGKTYRVRHAFRLPDGTVAAEVAHVSGLLDLKARRLVADPREAWRARAGRPELLGLA